MPREKSINIKRGTEVHNKYEIQMEEGEEEEDRMSRDTDLKKKSSGGGSREERENATA